VSYQPSENRYSNMEYKACGAKRLKLPPISLGLWHNFGDVDDFQRPQISPPPSTTASHTSIWPTITTAARFGRTANFGKILNPIWLVGG